MDQMMLQPGIKGQATLTVCDGNTAKTMGSGSLEVLATPAMVALMERAAAQSVSPCLDEGQTTVGTAIQIQHLSATPVGMHVTAESELLQIDGRKLLFGVSAFDEKGLIGQGTHERFVVDAARFMAKAGSKRSETIQEA